MSYKVNIIRLQEMEWFEIIEEEYLYFQFFIVHLDQTPKSGGAKLTLQKSGEFLVVWLWTSSDVQLNAWFTVLSSCC